MTSLDNTRHCPMCEDSAKKILELEQRVKVLTDALNEISTFPRRRMPADIANEALNSTPQQTAAQIERWHIEWMMSLPVIAWCFLDGDSPYGLAAYDHGGHKLVAIPPLPNESNSPETDLDEAQRRQ